MGGHWHCLRQQLARLNCMLYPSDQQVNEFIQTSVMLTLGDSDNLCSQGLGIFTVRTWLLHKSCRHRICIYQLRTEMKHKSMTNIDRCYIFVCLFLLWDWSETNIWWCVWNKHADDTRERIDKLNLTGLNRWFMENKASMFILK